MQHPPTNNPLPGMARDLLSTITSRPFWRFVFFTSALTILSGALLGIGFFMISLGVVLTLLWLTPISPLAAKLLRKLTGTQHGRFFLPPMRRSVWVVVLFGSQALLYSILALLGAWVIATNGFLAQNMIYQLVK